MPPRKSSWEHFGGRKDDQQGVKILEADLCLWAHNKFTPVQAQAKLCHNNMYAATYRCTMEVRKEFMPGIVQNYNKSKQVTATGQPSKVSIFKGKLNPMHLSVQKEYLKDKVHGLSSTLFAFRQFHHHQPDLLCQTMMQVDDMQGLAFDEQAWAVEHFLLDDPKVQQQLFKYLILPAKDLEKEGMPSNANQDQQQSWILQKAAADYTAFVASTAQLALSICPDITVDHLQPEAAGVVVEQYAKQLGHSLQQWTDSTVALANIKQMLDGLGLASVAWHSQEAAIAHAVAVNQNSEPHADAAALDTDSIANLGSELLQV